MKLRTALAACLSLLSVVSAEERKPNVLLILVDDLKPVLGAYGDPVAQTPNLDKFAASGMRFDKAYCNQAVCAPSRYNYMLGSRSTSTGLYHLNQELRKFVPDAVTLPQYFAKFGYSTQSLGKTYHVGHGIHGDPQSWTVPPLRDQEVEYALKETTGGQLTREEAYFNNIFDRPINDLPKGPAWEEADVPDEAYADGRVAAETIKRLEAAAQSDEPFLIAVGFARPHLPFTVPKKYWDLYDPKKLPMPKTSEFPQDSPPVAHKHGGEIANYKPVPNNGLTDPDLTRQLIHGYYAATSYTDAQAGKVLDALDRLKLSDNTIVILWGDHGFHLGDHGTWTKHTNYEQANRIPIIIRAPGVTQPGTSTEQLAQTVDIYPTAAALAGLPAPEGPQPIDGHNLVPVLKDPKARISDHVYHAFPHAVMGRAIRTDRYRMVEWKRSGAPESTAKYELYDYERDPEETQNLAAKKPKLLEKMKEILHQYPEAVIR
ncbi:iduronate 2-sulfatase [Haloferula luteola]|uniref:Iduronate 2-sulfatase n=2 Tax=Haloferula luteola TaxID=595692 RepID=A0A840V005_9BACT|nr:sulfatase [Haloferula luteola]MBB5351325.1 iduronate 2-sulfatase [Haloferula luteola]